MLVFGGGGVRVLLCNQNLYYRRDQFDCHLPNGLNYYLSLNDSGAHSTGERFRATMSLLCKLLVFLVLYCAIFFVPNKTLYLLGKRHCQIVL